MCLMLILSEVAHAAFVALVDDHVQVTLLMVLPITFCNELFTAEFTIVILLTCMDFDVLTQATLILENLATLLVGAPV